MLHSFYSHEIFFFKRTVRLLYVERDQEIDRKEEQY